MAEYKKRDELLEENEQLRKDLEARDDSIRALTESRDEAEDFLMDLQERMAKMEALVAQKAADGQPYDPAPELPYDPFDEQHPHRILDNPEGWVLSWKNPNLREKRGWRGWIPITYDDEYGKELDKYLQDPPKKMEGIAHQDNYVRRGTDSILCRIPEDIWKARQMKRELKANRKLGRASASDNTTIQHGVETYGDGLKSYRGPSRPSRPHTPEVVNGEHRPGMVLPTRADT